MDGCWLLNISAGCCSCRGHTDGALARSVMPLVRLEIQSGDEAATRCKRSAAGVGTSARAKAEQMSVHNHSAGIIVLTLISVQPSPSSPFILQNTHRHMHSHAHTHRQTCRMAASFRTVASSEQASPPPGSRRLEPSPKGKTREERPPFFCISIPLFFSQPRRVCHSATHPLQPTFLSPFLSPLHKFFPSLPFISLQPTVGRLNCSPSSCQGSATGNAFKPNESRAETEQPLCDAKAPLRPASEK